MSASNDPSDGSKSQVAKRSDSISQQSDNSQTAAEFLQSQMQLEAEAREALPYSINTCTYPQGPLRQSIFSCLTCNPPPADLSIPYDKAAGICYACSVQCHGDHQLVEIFSKRNFTCDCGTDRMPSKTPCSLRNDSKTGKKGAVGDKSAEGNRYNHNFRNYFCSCRQEYDAFSQKEAHPWAKKYAGLPGFLPAVFAKPQKEDSTLETTVNKVESGCKSDIAVVEPKKRKAEELESDSLQVEDQAKRARTVSVDLSAAESLETDTKTVEGAVSIESGFDTPATMCKVSSITPSPDPFSLFCCPGFRDNLCPCSTCQLTLSSHPQLLEEEETYEPSISANSEAGGQSTAGSGSLYDRGESALKNMDRVRAIEGVMAYNMMKEKLKPFFEQFAGSGKAISADDIKDYFAKLRGDEQGMKDAQQAAEGSGVDRDKREEQDSF
ncbi:Protein mlo2 [Ceratocystis fimbriata CBS 114723]|uniref:Protein mlo2 n=1 Tax=Ceratocystis fimbriata CBS 114723 TaxID=1035309 RepID=A0A2C5X7C9_9PEZI|nr:Protein mlo2 [Ceratocystis fimbriata CBS 114723]